MADRLKVVAAFLDCGEAYVVTDDGAWWIYVAEEGWELHIDCLSSTVLEADEQEDATDGD